MILVTGGAGFIGSNLVHYLIRATGEPVLNLDKLTYAGNLRNLIPVCGDPRHVFVRGDIADRTLVSELLARYRPRAILNLAAESHVDRSIHDPESFIQTNVVGTLRLLEAARAYWLALPADEQARFRFLHVSTDEVYGSLAAAETPFDENTPYAPNSPYAASKAASDHLVRSFHRTYGLPVLTTNCSNTYGPYQFLEKLIPLTIHRALDDAEIPIYGDGQNIRDWLHVSDHCAAIERVLSAGRPGETYNIGAAEERANLQVVHLICAILDEKRPRHDGGPYAERIAFVEDRAGHDRRYAIDASKIRRELGWAPQETFEAGLRKTVSWYLENQDWVRDVTTGAYRDWVARQYGGRTPSPQRHHSGGRFRNAALPAHQGRVEAAAAGVRQAADLLSALHPDAGRDPRHPDHLDAG
jgi:dTDP-glucose 4,6-dehydratase